MGLEYPFLALITFMIFASMITSLIFSYILIDLQLQRLPYVEGYTSSNVEGEVMVIKTTLRLVRGTYLSFRKVYIESDLGLIELNLTNSTKTISNTSITLRLERFSGHLVKGQEGCVVVLIEKFHEIYGNKKDYNLLIVFDVYVFSSVFSLHS